MEEKPILLVEDDPNDVELTLLALKRNGIRNRVVVTNDGLQALEYLFAQGRHSGRNPAELPALVLLDLKMPFLNGLEVLKRIRANETARVVPILVLTSSTERSDIMESYELGANGYLQKPADFDDFVRMVKQVSNYWLVLNLPARVSDWLPGCGGLS